MANRRQEERERLRQARQEREAAHSSAQRRRLTVVYAAAGAIALIAVAVVVIVAVSSSSGGSGDSGGSHIDTESGSTNGVKPDERAGTPPPALHNANLKTAAREAGCVLRLHLKDEGHQHIAPTAPTPHYGTNPPTSGTHVEAPYEQADGAYAEMPHEIDFVHSLEHGRVEI